MSARVVEPFVGVDMDCPSIELRCRPVNAVGAFEVSVEISASAHETEATIWLPRKAARDLANYINRSLA